MTLYVCISYCEDQNQVFHDVVDARNEDRARTLGGLVRGHYATITDVMTLANFQNMAKEMSNYTGADIISRHNWKEKKEEYD